LGELERLKKTRNFATRLYADYVEACIDLGTVSGKENNLDEEMKCCNKAITVVAIFLERHFS